MIELPRILDDGSHIIPIHRICIGGNESAENVLGEIRWAPNLGVTFRVCFPGVCSTSIATPLSSAGKTRGVGKICDRPNQPNLTAKTSEGHRVELFGTQATAQATQTTGTAGFSQHTIVNGTALFVRLRISKENDLSLWHETVGPNRLFLQGLSPFHWPEQEEIEFPHRDGVTRTTRCSLLLREKHLRRIFAAGPASGFPTCAWLVFEDTPEIQEKPYIPCESERPFFSFLAGKRIPYVWWDRFVNDSELERTYFGWQQFNNNDNALYTSQTLPLGKTVEALQIGNTVVEKLPKLFARFVEIDRELPISWIMSPLWAAHQGVLDDRLALACVSLERLAASFRNYCKSQNLNSPRKTFWESQKGDKVRKALKKTLSQIGEKIGLTDDQTSILLSRLENLGQPPNIDSLTAVFEYLGIDLTHEESETFSYRNRALHGRRTLTGSEAIDNVDDEIQRFDTLRMLVHRALLGLLQYDGPYVDYASRPVKGNFEIKRLNNHPS